MMVANSSNLIITVKPANQRTLMPRRGSFSRNSNMSHGSLLSKSSTQSGGTDPDDHDDDDEIRDLTNQNNRRSASYSSSGGAGGHLANVGKPNSQKQVLHL